MTRRPTPRNEARRWTAVEPGTPECREGSAYTRVPPTDQLLAGSVCGGCGEVKESKGERRGEGRGQLCF